MAFTLTDSSSPEDSRECESMPRTMLSARRLCSTILPRLVSSSPATSSSSSRVFSSSFSRDSPRISFISSVSSREISEKFLMKLSGFLISWATPAVS